MKNNKDMVVGQISGMVKGKQDRFDKTHKGECKVRCRLESENVTSNKGKNYIKILMWINKNRINIKEISMEKFNLACITFQNNYDANYCLECMKKAGDKVVSGFIDIRSTTCKSVITNWPFDIPILWEEIVDKQEIIKIERMRRKVWNREEKKWKDQKTDNLIITMRGSRVKESIRVFKNIGFGIKIRPFIESVKQCYKYFKYGHLKAMYKSTQRCIRCGEESHGI